MGCIAQGARAQVPAIQSTSIGKVMAASSGITVFRFAASSGAVTVVSGAGSRISTGTARFLVNIPCTGTPCDKRNMVVKVGSIGTPVGRAGSLTNFTAAMGTASLVSGPSGTNPITFTIGPIGKNNAATFYIGADFPIYGDDSGKATGSALSSMYVTTSDTNGNFVNTSSNVAAASVERQLSLSETTALNFGSITRPASGTCTIALPATTGTRTVTGCTGLASPAPSRAAFSVTGEASQTFTVTAPSSFTMSQGASSFTVSTSNTAQGTQILSSQGAFTFYVGGAFSIGSTTASGAYSGTYNVSVAYN